MTVLQSGPHLAVIRRFIQNNAANGSDVTWGSMEFVHMRTLTVAEWEQLAQEIANAVNKERN